VQEYGNQGFWVPGGRVEEGETIEQGAIRETKEEAGVDVRLTGILRVEYRPCKSGRDHYVRMRVIYLGEPIDPNQLPKCRLEDFS